MRKISLLAVAMILVGVGAWATTTNSTPTPHDAPAGFHFNPLQGLNTRDVPTLEFVDCAYVTSENCTEPRLIYPRSETASR
jgi:hypothetical protein